MVGYWRLDNASTTALDASWNRNHGTGQGSITIGGVANQRGTANGATSFDGSDDYISWAASSVFDIKDVSEKPFSISLWINPSRSAPDTYGQVFLGIGTTEFNAVSFILDDTEKLWIVADTNGSSNWDILQKSTSAISLDTWSYVTVTRDTSGNYKFYINASDAGGSFTQASDIFIDTNIMKLGAHYSLNPDWDFAGSLSDVRIYNRALSATEISNLYNATNP